MQLLIILILIILMYTVGYLTGYKECENMAQEKINKMIKEHLEMKEYKISKYEEKESWMKIAIILVATMLWIGINRICDKLEDIETALLMQSMELMKIRQGTDIE